MHLTSAANFHRKSKMRTTLLVSFLATAALAGIIGTRTEFEKEISGQLNVDEFKKDMKELDKKLEKELQSSQAEVEELLKNIGPIDKVEAQSEHDEEELNKEKMVDLYEGDIVLTNAQLEYVMANETERAKRQASTKDQIWGTAPIPFSFAAGVSEEVKSMVREATRFWTANTCVNFLENGPGTAKILVVNKGGCYSSIGKVGGTQELSLQNNGCNSVSTATHELEHALGVYHEQSRADRDNYVSVNTNNIPSGSVHNFNKEPTSASFNVPYEFGSNMHYTSDSFAKDWTIPTLVAKGAYAEYQDSMRGHMPSFLDVLKVNRYYKCDQACASRTNTCKNGGYLDVRTCSKCICPEGWGGQDCTAKPDGADEFTATTGYTTKTLELGTYGQAASLKYTTKAYIINAPAGKRIEVTIVGLWSGSGSGCRNQGIELKTRKDLGPRGLRFCGNLPKKTTYWSDGNRFPILMWQNEGSIRADIKFRYA